MRRALASPELIVVAVVAVVLAALSASSRLSSADVRLTAGADGSLTLSNSKEGSAILALDGMRPGDTVDGTLTIGNTGTVPGDLSLSTSNLVDTPGPGGGTLSDELDLVIADVTNAASPATVYTGTIAALMPSALGTLAPGASRTYEFRVSFPDAGPGAEDAYQGSSLSVQFDWTAINDGIDTDAPETTITLAPGTLVASGAASFSFGASEVGSSFECSLDRTPFAGCTSPAAFSGLGDGGHSFDVRATDEAGNADASPARHVWTVDATSPSATLNDPGAHLRGTVALTSATSDSGSGVASVSYQRSPSGAGSWTAIPAAWNTTVATDGLYDLRVVVADEAGNSTVSAPVPGRLVDNTAPTVPAAFKGLVRGGKLKLTWSGSTDASGVARYRIYANGSVVRTRGASRRSAKLGKFRTSDRRSFQVAAEDAAGNTSSRSRRLKVVPRVTRLQLGAAKKALAKRGFEIGTVTRRRSARVPRGVVIRGKAAGVRPAGSKIGLIVSGGSPSVPRTGFDTGSTPLPPPASPTGSPPPAPAPTAPPSTPAPLQPPTAAPAPDGASGPASAPTPTLGAEAQPVAGRPGPDLRPEPLAERESSQGRRRVIYGLLVLACCGASLAAVRRLLRSRRAQTAPGGLEPLLLWDARLLQLAARFIRRLAGR